jgi:polyisoprenoid-binding protein YceI
MLSLAGSLVQAQTETVRLAVGAGSKLWIEGGSNLHGWSCKASTFDAAIAVDPSASRDAINIARFVQRVEVAVPVTNLKCGHGQMDKNLYKALKADATSAISYILGSFDVVPGEARSAVHLATVGTLRVAGQENSVRMDVTARWLPDGSIQAEGALPILMTDFGIKPPTALLGTLKTDNKVIVKFELLVGPETILAAIAER